MMRFRNLSIVMLATLLLGAGVRPSSAASKEKAPYARVYLALRGCTSCSHCRSAIRQMARSSSGGGSARVTTDAVEVRYAKPGPIPLREVIRRLAENRLHDLTLIDVLFEVSGTLAPASDGEATFTLRGTRQSFPVAIDPALLRLDHGRLDHGRLDHGAPVRLTAVVEGWRGKGELKLVARELRRES